MDPNKLDTLCESTHAFYRPLDIAFVKVAGRDRLSFLQGQLSNDVATLTPGKGVRACLLNNTGHLVADLVVFAFDGHVLLEVAPSRAAVVASALERFIIREKVLIETLPETWATITLQGGNARAAWEHVDGTPLAIGDEHAYLHEPLPFTASDGSSHGEIVKRPRVGEPDGYDIWLPHSIAPEIVAALADLPGVTLLGEDDYEALRIAAGEPKWGAELTEATIPLEAGLLDAISFTKGCYMGQEIIARIYSRGHTNRTLRRLRLTAPAATGDKLIASGGERDGEEVGWITSAATSPTLGSIALGYVRNEYAGDGATVTVNGRTATVIE